MKMRKIDNVLLPHPHSASVSYNNSKLQLWFIVQLGSVSVCHSFPLVDLGVEGDSPNIPPPHIFWWQMSNYIYAYTPYTPPPPPSSDLPILALVFMKADFFMLILGRFSQEIFTVFPSIRHTFMLCWDGGFIQMIITDRQRNCRKVMFLVMSVCLHGGVRRDHYPWCIEPHHTGTRHHHPNTDLGPVPPRTPSAPAPPKHVQTCSSWTSLYRDPTPPWRSNSFIVKLSGGWHPTLSLWYLRWVL